MPNREGSSPLKLTVHRGRWHAADGSMEWAPIWPWSISYRDPAGVTRIVMMKGAGSWAEAMARGLAAWEETALHYGLVDSADIARVRCGDRS